MEERYRIKNKWESLEHWDFKCGAWRHISSWLVKRLTNGGFLSASADMASDISSNKSLFINDSTYEYGGGLLNAKLHWFVIRI